MLDFVPSQLRYKSGVYIISHYSSPSVNKYSRVLVKIGKGVHQSDKSSIYNRIDSYHTALPKSFYIFSVIVTSNPDTADELERYIHKRLKDYLFTDVQYQARKQGEWFILRKNQLIDYLNDAIREKYSIIRGLFNYNSKYFALSLPKDLGNIPYRTLYKSFDNPEPKAGLKVGKKARKRVTSRTTGSQGHALAPTTRITRSQSLDLYVPPNRFEAPAKVNNAKEVPSNRVGKRVVKPNPKYQDGAGTSPCNPDCRRDLGVWGGMPPRCRGCGKVLNSNPRRSEGASRLK